MNETHKTVMLLLGENNILLSDRLHLLLLFLLLLLRITPLLFSVD